MAGVADSFIALCRRAVGLSVDAGEPPSIMHLGLYPANVDACAADGSACDVTPADKRISPEKNVKVKAGIPGAVAVVSSGAVVLYGWEGGDPARPYCMPAWGNGASVSKLILKANMVFIGDEAGAKQLVTKDDFDSHVHTGPSTVCVNGAAWTGSTAVPTNPATGTAKLKAV